MVRMKFIIRIIEVTVSTQYRVLFVCGLWLHWLYTVKRYYIMYNQDLISIVIYYILYSK